MASDAENVSIWWRHHEQYRFSEHEHQTHLPNWRWYYSRSENNTKASLDTTGMSCHWSSLHHSFCPIILSHFLINSRDLCTFIHLCYCQGVNSLFCSLSRLSTTTTAKRKHNNREVLHYWSQLPVDSPHKGPVMRAVVSCHNLIIYFPRTSLHKVSTATGTYIELPLQKYSMVSL